MVAFASAHHDEYGRPILSTRRPNNRLRVANTIIRARYDAAQVIDENRRHWANADGLSADAAASPGVRRQLRNRCRYEANENNSYAKGITLTIANDTIGTGPRLQMLTDDPDLNRRLEQSFKLWARAVKLARKLRGMRMARVFDGEAFALLTTNSAIRHPVKLDLRTIEADQIATPDLSPLEENAVDGIRFDDVGNPTEYHVLKQHPGSDVPLLTSTNVAYDAVPAGNMIHMFREDRPGQRRGIPELTPALPLFALLRRYTLAVLGAAETAADFAAVIQTENSFDDDGDGGSAVSVLDTFELEARMATVLPDGYKLAQLKAEQPTTAFAEFKREILSEAARCILVPYNIAASDSSDHNYASGRLDHQTYHKAIGVDQHDWECEVLDSYIFPAWLETATDYADMIGRDIFALPHHWFWDGMEHVDPVKEANAIDILLDANAITLADVYGRKGQDWESKIDQRGKELERMREKGIIGGQEQPDKSTKAEATAAGRYLEAEAEPTAFRFADSDAAPIELQAVADGDENRVPRFSGVAYTGGLMRIKGFRWPVVVDLQGMTVSQKPRPILREHKDGDIVGHSESIEVTQSRILVAGQVSGTGPAAREVLDNAGNGFPWQMSIGAAVERIKSVPAGQTVTVNGRTFNGPILVAKRTRLSEISFVARGADDDTSARIAAHTPTLGDVEMTFEQWLEAKGFDLESLTEVQQTTLKATYDAEQVNDGDGDGDDGNANGDGTTVYASAGGEGATLPSANDMIAEQRRMQAAETRRVSRVRELCAGGHTDIEAQAIEEGWDESRTELAVLRDQRTSGPAIHAGGNREQNSQDVLEAALCMAAGLPEDGLLASYGERTMEAAYPLRAISLRELVANCARLEGQHVPAVFGDGRDTIRAGFSTVSLPYILENVMNKTMLAAYQAALPTALQLCRVSSVSDFKQVSRLRLLGTGGFSKVAADGELKHGMVDEQRYTNQAETYGQILMLTRQMIINDDLGAFMDLPQAIGRSGAAAVDDLFFTLLLSNPGSFFASGNNNYQSGATTAFSADSLTAGKTLFRKLKAGPGSKAKDKKPINIRPKTLLVPVELETEAELLMGSAQIMVASGEDATTKMATDNPHRNKYQVVSAPHLSDSYYTGYSALAWYLFADPAVVAAFELVFLNGRQTPTIERVEAPADTLGMGFRGYIDVGVKEQDPNGAIKSKGEA